MERQSGYEVSSTTLLVQEGLSGENRTYSLLVNVRLP
jgi:hypothetical protein